MINFKAFRRAVSISVAAAVVFSAPGFTAYASAAEVIRIQAAGSAQGPRVVAVPMSGAMAPSLGLPSLGGLSLSAASLPSAAPSAAALPAAAPLAPAALQPAAAALTSLPLVQAPEPRPAARTAAIAAALNAFPAAAAGHLSSAQAGVTSALEAAGDLASAAPSSLRSLGEKLEAAITGAPALTGTSEAAPSVRLFEDLTGRDGQLARPAGDLIRQSAEAHDGPTAPVPPSAPKRTEPQGPKGPFWPKLLAAGLALLPAYFLGLPMLAAGSIALGYLTIGGSAALAVMPFLEHAPKFVRAVPGVLLGALGVASVVSGFVAPGLFAVVGGWGLVRYALGKSNLPRYESIESLSAYFGGVAALTGVAIAAAGPVGMLAVGIHYAAYPLAALLWLHLPSWVGEGMGTLLEGIWLSTKGLQRVLSSTRRDTVLLDRLSKFSERQLDASKWNGVWLAVMWTPIVLFEAGKWVLGVVAGLYAGAVQAPVMFLWGASYKLFGEGKAAAYFGEAARFPFDRVQNGKVALFNKAEAYVLPFANSASLPQRALGSLGMVALQLGWVLYTAVAVPLLSIAGLIFAFGRMGAFSAERHSPSSLKINTSDSPGEKPTEPTDPTPTTPAKAPFAPKLIAAALALAPAVYFGLPLVTGTLFAVVGILYGVLVLPLAAMPFMGPRTPRFLKSLAARGLQYNGLALFLSGHAVIIGLLAILAGWGFSRYVASRDDGKVRSFDDASELGAFFGALGSAVAIGAAWTGLAGPWGLAALGFAVVTSPFLIMHLPEWVFSGVLGALKEFPKSMRAYADVAAFWHDDTKFMSNLRAHADFWLKKTYWNGVWLSLIWVPTGAVSLVEYALALALGAVTGLVRAPLGYLSGALKNAKPSAKATTFSRAALDGWRGAAEGSKPLFDRMIAPLKPAMDEASPVSGRPTLKAALALLGARFIQLAWLIGVLAMNVTGAALIVGLYRGVKAALAAKPDAK